MNPGTWHERIWGGERSRAFGQLRPAAGPNPQLRRLGALAAALALVVDQLTKAWAYEALWPPYSEGVVLLPVLSLRLGFNTGISFGLLAEVASGVPWMLIVATVVMILLLSIWWWRASSAVDAAGLGLMIGGAFGNVIDRIQLGVVIDFIDAHYGHLHWPTFNMADVAIVCGVALLLLGGLRTSATEKVS